MSSNRLALVTILLITFLFLVPTSIACTNPYPLMDPGRFAGTVKGKVFASDGATPLSGARVSIVNASNPGMVYESTSAGDDGSYSFSGVNSTSYPAYKIKASYAGDEVTASCYNEAMSSAFAVGSGATVTINLVMSSVAVVPKDPGATARPKPTCEPVKAKPILPPGNHSSYPPMQPDDKPGIVTGVVLAADGETPVSGAYVAIMSAGNVPKVNCVDGPVEYSCMYTDCNGFYQFCGVNSTAEAVYKLYVSDGMGNTAYSEPFKVPSGETVKIIIAFSPKEDPKAPTPTVEPSVTPVPDNDVNVTALTQEPMLKELSASKPQGEQGFIEQLTGFIGSFLASVLPK